MKYFRFAYSILWIIPFLYNHAVAGSDTPFFIQHFDNSNGLSNSSINKLFKDADDILWVATWDGLNMYDGNTFHVFNYGKESDSKNIGSNVIQDITEDRHGNIWITTIEGISRYEKRTGRFFNYFYKQYQPGKVSEHEYEIAVDTSGMVYCLSQKNGMSYYDAAADSFIRYVPMQRDMKIAKLGFDSNNQLWVLGVNGQLDVYNLNDKNLKLLYTIRKKNGINNLFIVSNDLFYSTSDDSLFSVNTQTFIQKSEMHMPRSLGKIIFYQGHYLLAWNSKGYSVYDDKFRISTFLASEARQMQDIKITSFSPGTEDILWCGTDGNGIIKIYPKTKSFGTVASSDGGMSYNRPVRAFCEEDGNLWVGTKGSGIIKMENFWQQVNTKPEKKYFQAPAELDNNAVYALKNGADGLIYIGTDGKGIGVYDLITKKFHKWASVKAYKKWPEFGSVYAIFQDADHSLWLGTSGYGLIHLKINKDQSGDLSVAYIEKFTFNNSDTGPANDIIYSLAPGDENLLWIGCRYGGLSLFNKVSKKFKNFKAFTYDGSLSNNDVLSVFKDSKNRIWVGTSYGLNLLPHRDGMLSDPVFQKLTTANGLPNNTIHAIAEDRSGQIWVSTNKGLAKVDPSDLKISFYQQSDGLQSNEFCDGAVWKDEQDNLFFGGIYGFNNFLPQNIHKSDWLPNLYVSDISIGGKSVTDNGVLVLRPEGGVSPEFVINRKDNFFELNVKALSFLNADKCEYAYFLDGYDKDWHYTGTARKIVYSNIPPGSYNLKIIWSNGEGLWTNELPLMKVEVKQFLWLMPYAFLIYILLISSIIYILYRYRKNKMQIKYQLEVANLMRIKEDEIHRNRLGFFTNIAHELQTPLTLIMGATERSMDKSLPEKPSKERNYFFSIIHQQASKLTYLVHQLLEFRKVEEGFMKNQYQYLDITELMNNLAGPFIALADQQRIQYDMDIEPGIKGMADKDKVEKIIFNLLSNAFKYSGKDEHVDFKASENKPNHELEITVANSGIDLSPEQLDQLFDKFYTDSQKNEKSDKFGTGIGLAFTRQLVTMLNGQITARCADKWISFKVILPMPQMQNPGLSNLSVVSDEPSYLFQTITNPREADHTLPVRENNKDAFLENLLNQDNKNVLIVEDEPEIRFLLKDILKDDYIVYEAADGREALDLIDRILPDIIVCDVMMPHMSGLELCHKLKNDVATCHTPVILLTARGSEDHHIEGFEAGADAYIPKPFNTHYLKVRIRKLLEYHQKLHDIFKNNASSDTLSDIDMPEDDKAFLTRIVELIENNLDEPQLNTIFLEKNLCMSKMQLYRKLKSLSGMSPGEFIKHIRLKAAARLLTTTGLTVSEIFFRTGFNNQSYFFREFKKIYQCAPNEYREKNTIRNR